VPRSPYRKGARYEYYVKQLLEERGYLVVRTAGSHGPFDLIAIDKGKREILLVQVTKRKHLPAQLKRELASLAGTYVVRPIVYQLGEWIDLSQSA
jgi:Holliday junction resolvase